MRLSSKIGVLGGDLRQLAVCQLISGDGIECALWTTDPAKLKVCGCSFGGGSPVKCIDWKSTLTGADAVILPLPLTTDGVRLNCGKRRSDSETYIPRITEIIENTDRSTILLAGKIPATVQRLAAEHGIRMIDYYESEDFQIKNAVPTAEGAIAIAINEMDITLHRSTCAVLGYGRIGRTLATKLIALGAEVTCIARSKRDLAWAECDGCHTVTLVEYTSDPDTFDAVFNTIPHTIYDASLLEKLDRNSLIIDLASQSGCVDSALAETYGVNVIKALSLPGKCAPRSAGTIIYDTVSSILREEGVL